MWSLKNKNLELSTLSRPSVSAGLGWGGAPTLHLAVSLLCLLDLTFLDTYTIHELQKPLNKPPKQY